MARRVLAFVGFGSPSTVVEALNRSLGRLRCTHFVFGTLPGMAPERTRASMARFAKEVVPQLA